MHAPNVVPLNDQHTDLPIITPGPPVAAVRMDVQRDLDVYTAFEELQVGGGGWTLSGR